MTIKAIQTRYNGYHFRSRLEARWAVFFDALGIEYQYEPEGFDLDVVWYLPDFYLPHLDLFLEIKPRGIPSNDEIFKVKKLSEIPAMVVLCVGSPYPDEYKMLVFAYGTQRATDFGDKFIWALMDGVPDRLGVICPNKDGSSHSTACWMLLEEGQQYHWPAEYNDWSEEILMNAYRAARSARFEHGETPTP